jgi:hypothetical protein
LSNARLALALIVGLALLPARCKSAPPRQPPEPPAPPPSAEPLPVKKVDIDIVVAAWAEPSRLPYGGGDAQILVRVQKRGGIPVAGVEVRLATSQGTLFSSGHVLVTDVRGMTRDRLSTRRIATVVLNAGGTRYSFGVPVDSKPE